MKGILILAAALCAARVAAQDISRAEVVRAEDVPAGFWNARLWLTSQAFGLREDCPVRVLFQNPELRNTATSRLVSREVRGGDLFVVIETAGGVSVEQVTLQLRWHRAEGIVGVESISLAGGGAGRQTLRYEAAIDDDEEYDLYTDTLVSLYRTLFDAGWVSRKAARNGG